jgi:apolipoprotein N-acyltransferase
LLLDYWFAGVLFNLGNLYWIYFVIQHYSSLPSVVAAGVLVLLCLILGAYWGIFGFVLRHFYNRLGLTAALLLAPFLWILLELVRNWMQFPWCLLGYSQYNNLPLAQFASVFGVYGLSALIVATNSAVALWVLSRKWKYLGSTISIILISMIGGHFRMSTPVTGESLRVGVVQGNIPQDVKINFEFAEEVNRIHLELTKKIIEEHQPDIVFWPESSTLYNLTRDGEWSRQVLDLARRTRTPLLLGSDSIAGEKIYNTAYLVDANGHILSADYSKMYLVPFGEFVPFKSIFFFAGKMVAEISDFSPGEKFTLFPVKNGSFAVHICFEVIFPQLTRRFCRDGADLLTTITNDAWFGRTSAPYQHFAMAVMRSIESKRYMVRAANTGISGIVDPYGRILKQTGLFVPASFSSDVKLIHENTIYTRYGDILLYAAAAIVAVAVIFSLAIAPKVKGGM